MLNLKKYFAIGEKIQLEYIDNSGQSREYTSQVVEMSDSEFVDVLIPIYKKQDVYLRKDTVLKIIVTKGEVAYELRAILYEKLFGRIPLLRLKVLSEIRKIQRRDFYRLKFFREIKAKHVIDLEQSTYGESFKCNLHDISAGGMLLSSKAELQQGDMIESELDLDGKRIVIYGTIVRKALTDNHRAPYSYGIRFDKMREYERNVITRFIFDEQRRLIKKGLL